MPELDLVHTGELQNFDDEKSVVVTARDGVRYEVRMPRTQAALLHLGLEIRSLQALTEAARTRLPFGVARLVGEAKHIKGARVWLFELVQGAPANLHRANANGTLAENLGEALGASLRALGARGATLHWLIDEDDTAAAGTVRGRAIVK